MTIELPEWAWAVFVREAEQSGYPDVWQYVLELARADGDRAKVAPFRPESEAESA